MPEKQRLRYIDNIRIFLTVIVILHHLAITYGAPGGWYYREFEVSQLDPITLTVLVLFVAANQAYFMGFFFFLGGFFAAGSLKGRGLLQFFFQRLIRLGIPVLLFVYLVSPCLRLIQRGILYDQTFTLDNMLDIYQSLIFGPELGPMWFVLLLLILSILYVLIKLMQKYLFAKSKTIPAYPTQVKMFTFAIFIGAITFLIRIPLPIGFVFQPFNLQIPFVPQYIGLFIIGIAAYHGNWFNQVKIHIFPFWRNLTLFLVVLMPLLFILSGGLEGDVTPALGGLHWQSLAYSLWEQLFCLGMILTLLSYFKNKFNNQGKITQELSTNSYAVYIFHTPVLVLFTISLRGVNLHPIPKILATALPALVLCFLSASLLRRLPGLKAVL